MSYREAPVFVPMGRERLCSVVCAPDDGRTRGVGVVLLTGGNYTRTHRNRMWVRVARSLAERGFPSIRVDYHGVGESTGTARFDLESPFDEDALAAAAFLVRATGVDRLALVATCFGGRSAMAAAARSPQAVSVTIFPVPLLVPSGEPRRRWTSRVAHWVRKSDLGRRLMRRPAARRVRKRTSARRERPDVVSPTFGRDLLSFLDRGEVRFIYGEHDDTLADLRRCLASIDGSLSEDRRRRLHVDIVPDTELHRFQSLESQDIVVERAVASVENAFEEVFRREAEHATDR